MKDLSHEDVMKLMRSNKALRDIVNEGTWLNLEVNGAFLCKLSDYESVKKAFGLESHDSTHKLFDYIKMNNPIASMKISKHGDEDVYSDDGFRHSKDFLKDQLVGDFELKSKHIVLECLG